MTSRLVPSLSSDSFDSFMRRQTQSSNNEFSQLFASNASSYNRFMSENAPQRFNLERSGSFSSSQALQSINRFVYKAGQFGNSVMDSGGRILNSAIDGGGQLLSSLTKPVTSILYGLRQEVPFERWFHDHNFIAPLDNCSDLIKAHLWAVVATMEGAVRALAEAVTYVFALVFEPKEEAERHLEVLGAQGTGLTLSLLAIISPNLAKKHTIDSDGNCRIGSSLTDWRWGTPYLGTFNIPFWKIECSHYPWADRPNS